MANRTDLIFPRPHARLEPQLFGAATKTTGMCQQPSCHEVYSHTQATLEAVGIIIKSKTSEHNKHTRYAGESTYVMHALLAHECMEYAFWQPVIVEPSINHTSQALHIDHTLARSRCHLSSGHSSVAAMTFPQSLSRYPCAPAAPQLSLRSTHNPQRQHVNHKAQVQKGVKKPAQAALELCHCSTFPPTQLQPSCLQPGPPRPQ